MAVLLNNTPSCTAPPLIEVSATPRSLWPPNGRMVQVNISGKITDSGATCSLKNAAYAVKDENGEIQPSGPVILTSGGAFSFAVLLQAARFGTDADGRLYTITVTASNSGNQIRSRSTTVLVPHDRGH